MCLDWDILFVLIFWAILIIGLPSAILISLGIYFSKRNITKKLK